MEENVHFNQKQNRNNHKVLFPVQQVNKKCIFQKIVNYIKVSLQWVLVGVGQGPQGNTADGTNLNIETSGASQVILLLGIQPENIIQEMKLL